MKYTYILINCLSAIVPFVFSFHKKIRFDKYFPAFLKASIITSALFLLWDAIFTSNGMWWFNSAYTTEIKIFNLPLEEVLFFICIPFSCVFTYQCITGFFKIRWNAGFEKYFIFLFSLTLLLTGLYFHQKQYTAVTFISTAILLLLIKFFFKASWLDQFLTVYCILLIPFIAVNGVLTGTGLSEPVVFYNNNENLNIRLLTIPVEDIIYGLELILVNIFFFERFKNNDIAETAS